MDDLDKGMKLKVRQPHLWLVYRKLLVRGNVSCMMRDLIALYTTFSNKNL